jgi:hypothetical protein
MHVDVFPAVVLVSLIEAVLLVFVQRVPGLRENHLIVQVNQIVAWGQFATVGAPLFVKEVDAPNLCDVLDIARLDEVVVGFDKCYNVNVHFDAPSR